MTQAERLIRICIFCGEPPEEKNREHPLPQWLLALTGDPKRVVTHAFDRKTGKPIRYAFDSFAFPSCAACNGQWSEVEGEAKRIVQALCRKEAVAPVDYVLLLDWLDKVRVGLWLGYRYIHQTPIRPKFAINTRFGMKDRMVAVYLVGDRQRGLNAYGAESPLFQYKPSAFALRINNILLLNASWDWMCAARCGYPYPQALEVDAATGELRAGSFRRRSKAVHPVMSGLAKPCVLLFQPVLASFADGGVGPITREDFDHCLSRTWPGRIGAGPLFRQLKSHTIQLDSADSSIEFDSVTGGECWRAIDLALQAYVLQNTAIGGDRYVGSCDAVAAAEKRRNEQRRFNLGLAHRMRSLTREQYLGYWKEQAK